MNIIIPLGGKGERFKKEGYNLPKPLIKVCEKEILFYVIDNLDIQKEDKVYIIYNLELDEYHFNEIIKKKYPFIELIKLNGDTKGASETVYIGTEYIINHFTYHNKTILIDGDTFYKENILEKFRNTNHNAVFYVKNYDTNPVFSYIKLDNNNLIVDIKEKNKISDNANTGVYAFQNMIELNKYAKYVLENNITFKNEPYTSCIIDIMLKKNEIFKGIECKESHVFVLGTPKQVNEFINQKSNEK